MRNLFLFLLALSFTGLMSCESDSLEKQSSIDEIVTLDDDGNITTIEIDRETGNVVNSDSETILRAKVYPDGYVFKGTVFHIEDHPNGNRRIDCWVSKNECYTVGTGPGPCETCN